MVFIWFCCFIASTATFLGFLAGVFLSVLSCFEKSLRRLVTYLLLMPICGAAGVVIFARLFVVGFNPFHYFSSTDDFYTLVSPAFGIFGPLLLGDLLGAAAGYFLARFLNRHFNPPTIRGSERAHTTAPAAPL